MVGFFESLDLGAQRIIIASLDENDKHGIPVTFADATGN
jgi:hypothetical protein